MSVTAFTDSSMAYQIQSRQEMNRAAKVSEIVAAVAEITDVAPSKILDWNNETNLSWFTETNHKIVVHVDISGRASMLFSQDGIIRGAKRVSTGTAFAMINALDLLMNY